jgi:hypothetical protein
MCLSLDRSLREFLGVGLAIAYEDSECIGGRPRGAAVRVETAVRVEKAAVSGENNVVQGVKLACMIKVTWDSSVSPHSPLQRLCFNQD